ncbi:MAG: hypothetical protein ACJ74E_01290 [Actinomycetes bacterium]
MTSTFEPVDRSDSDQARGRSALTASLAISGAGILVTLIAWVWANAQQVDYDDLDLTGVFSGQEDGFAYFAVYLTATFLAGLVALALALIGASSERARSSVAAGAMAMFLVMVPVVFVVGHEVNHWGGCISCGYGGD